MFNTRINKDLLLYIFVTSTQSNEDLSLTIGGSYFCLPEVKRIMEWFACTLFSHTKHPVPAVTASSLVRQSHWHLDVLMLGVCLPLSHGVCCRQQLHGTHCYQGHEGILWGGSQDRRGRFEGKLLICKTDSISSVFIESCCWRLCRLSDIYLTSGLTTFSTQSKVLWIWSLCGVKVFKSSCL